MRSFGAENQVLWWLEEGVTKIRVRVALDEMEDERRRRWFSSLQGVINKGV